MRGLSRLLLVVMLMPIMQNLELLDSSPLPGDVLTHSPSEVSLLFNRPMAPDQVIIRVKDANNEQVDNQDTTVDETNPNRAWVTLPTLPEGAYVVEYDVLIDESTTVTNFFTFLVIAPPPRLFLDAPANGDILTEGELALELTIDALDISSEDNAVRLYIDDELAATFDAASYTLEAIEPGVHHVEVVLAHNGEELDETRVGVYVAVPQPDPEAEGRVAAMTAPPDPGLQLAPWQIAAVVVIGLAAFGAGIWLGRSSGEPNDPTGGS